MKRHLIAGLILLLPLAMTIAIIAFVVNFLTKPFMGFVSHLLSKTDLGSYGFFLLSPQQTVQYTSQLIILICLFLAILIIGMFARWYLVHWLFQVGDKILHRLPLINKIYKTTKDIITNLLGHGKTTFKQVVLVPFPGEGMYSIGLLSQSAPELCSKAAGKTMASVFIMTSPNPTTGFTVLYAVEEIIFLDLKPEDAIKYIVSCGMVIPPSAAEVAKE